ncbi:halocyanin [Halorientalis sp. IM1011]|uniref:halocyanin domain-containing protein n=1 Tax=Halorientalis sp. IM1011 TaxID=1932360 RepID=UPI00097CD343|nr:halocyanin domain-containing protein [Halorientalis sp. IM1011]AQL43822.1 halocyanin [Halorientalis sp. IM1011]
MNRRDFIRTAGGAAGATAAVSAGAGTAAASSEGGDGGATRPDFGGYLDDANGYGGGQPADQTGNDEVTVQVGTGSQGYGFSPPAVHVDTGTTVVWEWTGEGGAHNVVSNDEVFDSGAAESGSGVTFEYTFEEGGIYNYHCVPHEGMGMKGSIVVGSDYPTVQMETGGGEKSLHEMGVPFQAHYVGLATILMVIVSLVFTFFLLKYGESPHTKGGND